MRHVRMLPRLALAMVILASVSCDRVPDVAGPADLAPQFNGVGGATASEPAKGRAWKRVDGFIVQGEEGTALYPAQNHISLGNHTLSIPPAATIGPVLFVMSGESDDEGVVVRLTASTDTDRSNNVGSAGFRRPVTLCLYHADIVTVQADQQLHIAKVLSDDTLELVPSTVNATHVCAQLKSFSNYTMVTD